VSALQVDHQARQRPASTPDETFDTPLSSGEREELQQLRNFKAEVQKTLFAEWKPVDRLTEIFFCVETFDTPPEQPLLTSGRKIAKALGISPTTASNSVRRLSNADLVEGHIVKRWYDRSGNEVDPRQVDLNATDARGKPLYHVESESFYYKKPLPFELPNLRAEEAETERDKATKATAKRKRERLKELEGLVCPCCEARARTTGERKKKGRWHAKCLDCGAKFTSELEGETYQSTPPTKVSTPPDESFDTPPTSAQPVHNLNAHTDTRQALTPPLEGDLSLSLPEPVQNVDALTNSVPENGHPPSVEEWLGRMIGADTTLSKQKHETLSAGKYVSLGKVAADLRAYLAGEIVLGSRPRQRDGLTWFVIADCDDLSHEEQRQAVRELAGGGLSSLLFERRENRGRLIVAFDAPVDPDAGKELILSLAPSLASVEEWYPCESGPKSRGKSNLGWPLTRIAGDGQAARAVSCPLYALTPEGEVFKSLGWLEGEQEQEIIRRALAACINSAEMIPARVAQPEKAAARGGVSASQSPRLQAPSKRSQSGGDDSIVRQAILWWNEQNPLDRSKGYFAVRDEKTPSVLRDYDDFGREMYTDFGTGEKLDPFEIYVRENNLNKRVEVSRVVGEYRAHLKQESARYQEERQHSPQRAPQEQKAPLAQEVESESERARRKAIERDAQHERADNARMERIREQLEYATSADFADLREWAEMIDDGRKQKLILREIARKERRESMQVAAD
jgi:DNA-binding MarR family transcriptional regulator